MVTLNEIAEKLSLVVLAGHRRLGSEVKGGYVADLLSCAMAGAHPGSVWVTLQGHANVVAVAALNDLAGVVVTEGKSVSPDAIARAEAEGIPLLTTPLTSYELTGRLWELGVKV